MKYPLSMALALGFSAPGLTGTRRAGIAMGTPNNDAGTPLVVVGARRLGQRKSVNKKSAANRQAPLAWGNAIR